MNSEQENDEKTAVIRVPNFLKHYVTNIIGGLTTQDFRYELMNEKIYDEEEDEWTYISDALLILSPVAAKRLFVKLTEDIELYEREHGEIFTEFDEEPTY
ncbi:MAG: DUF3467 domain-containing protein [Desulfobacterales bacterium]|nr:DUF3467 domain-containing protein [Desulfobacterales bacterium]